MKSKEFDVEIKHYTKYELARILGSRALQISMGAPILVKLTDDDLKRIHYNPIEIAKLELKAELIPITIKRTIPVTHLEEESEDEE